MTSGLLLALSRPVYLSNAGVKHLMMLIPVLEPNVVSGCIVLRECVVVRYFVVPRSPAVVLLIARYRLSSIEKQQKILKRKDHCFCLIMILKGERRLTK